MHTFTYSVSFYSRTPLFRNSTTKRKSRVYTHRPSFSDCFRSALWTFPYPPFPSALQGDLQLSSTAPPSNRESGQLRSIFNHMRLVYNFDSFFVEGIETEVSRHEKRLFTHFYHMLTKYDVSFLT